jgi:outer membrane protein OmpA-like peptidoglycan-associated protein
VVGHTASISANPGTGIKLSRRRAQAVKDALVAAGIAGARIKANGVGDTQPLAEDFAVKTGKQIESKAAKERRVTIKLEGVPCSG